MTDNDFFLNENGIICSVFVVVPIDSPHLYSKIWCSNEQAHRNRSHGEWFANCMSALAAVDARPVVRSSI